MKSPVHYEVSVFAMMQGMQDFDDQVWRPGLPPCCHCRECQSAYASGWTMKKNAGMFQKGGE